jgi:hypothetical protein
MSQRSVEQVIGRLATDEGFLSRFAADRAGVLDEWAAQGLELTPVERRALLDLDVRACRRFAARLHPRLLKVCLRSRLT